MKTRKIKSLHHKKTVRFIENYKPHRYQKDDLCNGKTCERLKPKSMNNLLPREMMPQFENIKEMKLFHKQINSFLRKQKQPRIYGKLTLVPLSNLKVSQREIRSSRTESIMNDWKSRGAKISTIISSSPMLTSTEEDGYHAIVDGHHRLMAARMLSESGHISPHEPIKVYVMHAPVKLLLSAANALGKNKDAQEF